MVNQTWNKDETLHHPENFFYTSKFFQNPIRVPEEKNYHTTKKNVVQLFKIQIMRSHASFHTKSKKFNTAHNIFSWCEARSSICRFVTGRNKILN